MKMREEGFSATLVSACGFYCGSCPTYSRGDCLGCRDDAENQCFTQACVEDKGLHFCGECDEFPCRTLLTREKVTVLDKRWLQWKAREQRQRSA